MHSSIGEEEVNKIANNYAKSRTSMMNIGVHTYDARSSNRDYNELLGSFKTGEITKPIVERYFSKMERGSLRGSVLGMTCAAIGSGVLTFPQVFKQIGFINGIVLLCMGAFGCWWSLYMLIQRARHHQLLNYSAVARAAGGKCLERTLQYSVLLYMFATCLACTIVITQLFVFVSNAFGVPVSVTGDYEKGFSWYKTTQAVITSAFILGPLSLGREMSTFKNLSLVSLLCLIITILLVTIEMPFYIEDY